MTNQEKSKRYNQLAELSDYGELFPYQKRELKYLQQKPKKYKKILISFIITIIIILVYAL